MDNNKLKLQLGLELIWWIITALVILMVVRPLHLTYDKFPFMFYNIVFIIVFITYARYIFLLNHTFIARSMVIKFGIILITIPLMVILVGRLHELQAFLDEEGASALLPFMRDQNSPYEEQIRMTRYARREYLFFGVGSIIVTTLMFFRMFLSVWRQYNKKARM